ncbi:hypothetical protein [Streptomyces litchfieldiae]|uniref:Uncharacterized protein n=1 Tax=Streptomyces litchfieldiae TaxID=3075543 RepID=A0ABU2MTZ2_9ACTN|nr:hypothetical protein [Streptomyces sp. DSM 44938]MDT0344549.1 hypothetical protein [Streptomyces sp. DSM 44938]
MNGVLMAIEVDAATIRIGDQLMIGGQAFTVLDMVTMGVDVKRLHFASGETFTMRRDTVLWATRRIDPRLRRRGRAGFFPGG